MIKTSITETKSSGSVFSALRSYGPDGAKAASHAGRLAAECGIRRQEEESCESLPGDAGFEGTKRSWRAAETWHHKSLGEPAGEGSASVAIEASGLKEP